MNAWISVNDELPDTDTTVLVAVADPDSEPVWLGYYTHDLDPSGEWRAVEAGSLKVTHWMHLPQPPQPS